MNIEIEAKFFIKHDDARKLLDAIGARMTHAPRTMRRVVIHTDDMSERSAFVRIRDEGYRVTITYKEFKNDTVDGAVESEIVVDNFDNAVKIFSGAGLDYDTYQESIRENWQLDGAEIMLDKWPWLDEFIEIEAVSVEEVRKLAGLLGLSWSSAIFGGVANVYRAQYTYIGDDGIDEINHGWSTMRFNDPKPSLLTLPK